MVIRKTGKKLSAAEAQRYEEIRRNAEREFPPARKKVKPLTADDSLGYKLRVARESLGLTWYAVAKAAKIPNSGTIRDIEAGNDAKLSNIEAIAAVLGMKLELAMNTDTTPAAHANMDKRLKVDAS